MELPSLIKSICCAANMRVALIILLIRCGGQVMRTASMSSRSNRVASVYKKRKAMIMVAPIALCAVIAGVLYVSHCMAVATSVMGDVREAMAGPPHELGYASELSPMTRYFAPVVIGEDEPVSHYVSDADCYFAVVGVAHGRMWLRTEITTRDTNGAVRNVSSDCVELCLEKMGSEWQVTSLKWEL